MPDAESGDLVPQGNWIDRAMSWAATITSAAPYIGGPLGNVLSGKVADRRFKRVEGVVAGMVEQLKDFQSEATEKYVETEEFEELLDTTLSKASQVRSEEKRKLYAQFLVGAVKSPSDGYDEQLRILRVVEQLQVDHVRILRALLVDPASPAEQKAINSEHTSSQLQVLKQRLPNMNDEHISDLVTQLNDLRVTVLNSLNSMSTPRGAHDLRRALTPFGERFVEYVVEPQQP